MELDPTTQNYLVGALAGFILSALGGYWALGRKIARVEGALPEIKKAFNRVSERQDKEEKDNKKTRETVIKLDSRVSALEGSSNHGPVSQH